MEQRYAIFAVLLASVCTFAHSFSTTSFQIKTTTTTMRKRNRNHDILANHIGSSLGSPCNVHGHGYGHGRNIHTALASETSLKYDDPYMTANKIEPKTQTISESLSFYAQFLVNHFCKRITKEDKDDGDAKNMIQRLLRRKSKPKKEDGMWKKFNEQRKNIMTLAGYTTSFVVPSFGFLLLGALMTSIVPSYWGKCIQCVATLTATKAQLVEALVGLGVTSLLAGLFTGVRGSLFWIGGKLRILRNNHKIMCPLWSGQHGIYVHSQQQNLMNLRGVIPSKS